MQEAANEDEAGKEGGVFERECYQFGKIKLVVPPPGCPFLRRIFVSEPEVDHQKQGIGTKLQPRNESRLLGGMRARCDETMGLC